MSTTYILRSLDSDVGNSTDFNKQLRQGTSTPFSQGVFISAGFSEDSFGSTEPGEPGVTGQTGDYSVTLNVTTGNTNLQLSIQLSRIDSVYNIMGTSAFSLEQTCSAGVKTFNFPAISLGTWAAGDRLRVVYRFRNTSAMMSQSCTVELNTASSIVVVPWTMPIVGDDGIFTTICSGDIARVHKWNDAGGLEWDCQINLVDESNQTIEKGLVRIQKGYNNNNKLFYLYSPWPSAGTLVSYRFGVIDTQTGVATQLLALLRPWFGLATLNQAFLVDRDDNMILWTDNDDPIPPGDYTRYGTMIKVSSAGVLLSEPDAHVPAEDHSYVCPTIPAGTPFDCAGNISTFARPQWLSNDGTKIYGLALLDGPPDTDPVCTCTPESYSWVRYSVDIASGAFNVLGTANADFWGATTTGAYQGYMPFPLGNPMIRYPNGHVVFLTGVKDTSPRYIAGAEYTNTGVHVQDLQLSVGLNLASILAGTSSIGIAGSVVSNGSTVWLRLEYTGSSGGGFNGVTSIYSTPYPLTSASVFTFEFSTYALTFGGQCWYPQLEINTGDIPEPPPEVTRRIAQATLIGAS